MLRNIQVALSSSLRQTSTLGLVSAFKSELRSALFSSSAREASDKDSPKRLQVCVVGSGPSGFYTVSQLLKSFGQDIHISLLGKKLCKWVQERLPTPYGLVRSGVAPDHPETKNVINQFAQLGSDAQVSFFGNVNVGQDVPLSMLRSIFDGVILAYGAESTRTLDIPGRHNEGVFTAREFVWWYNGHPEYSSLPVDLSKVNAVSILGLGNVALDCARILLQPPERLKPTDIASHALEQLQKSAVRQVDVIGRRGPAQAAFTAKELRELLGMEGINVVMPQEDMVISEADKAELKASRSRKRVFDLLAKACQEDTARSKERTLRMRFLRSPVEIVAKDLRRVGALRLETMRLEDKDGKQVAIPNGSYEDIQADMVLESIGYKSLPIAGAPFNERAGIIPNSQGRVLGLQEAVEPCLYVCGWLKRGPSGIIGTNLSDAQDTVRSVCEDVQKGFLVPKCSHQDASQDLHDFLTQKGVKAITFEDWLKIDAAERRNGESEGRERQKFISVTDMLSCAG